MYERSEAKIGLMWNNPLELKATFCLEDKIQLKPTTSACGARIAYGKVVCAHLTDVGSNQAGRLLLTWYK